ncbi:ATPase with role in protein import into the ER, partial [Ceratobasidium sp. 423]
MVQLEGPECRVHCMVHILYLATQVILSLFHKRRIEGLENGELDDPDAEDSDSEGGEDDDDQLLDTDLIDDEDVDHKDDGMVPSHMLNPDPEDVLDESNDEDLDGLVPDIKPGLEEEKEAHKVGDTLLKSFKVLNPSFWVHYLTQAKWPEDWIDTAVDLLEEYWEKHYKCIQAPADEPDATCEYSHLSYMDQVCAQLDGISGYKESSPVMHFIKAQSLSDLKVGEPSQSTCSLGEHDGLTQMVINVLSTPVTSVDVECMFSFVSTMASASLSAYSHANLIQLGCLKHTYEQKAEQKKEVQRQAAIEAETIVVDDGEDDNDDEDDEGEVEPLPQKMAPASSRQPVTNSQKPSMSSHKAMTSNHKPSTSSNIGDAAKAAFHTSPLQTVFDAKCLIGHKFDEAKVKCDMKHWPSKVINKGGKPMIQVKNKSELKGFMKESTKAYLGNKVTHAVVTVPAYFNDAQCLATKDASTITSLTVPCIINGPLLLPLPTVSTRRAIIICNLSGGTFDVSLLSINDGVFKVLATASDTHPGGEDFDNHVIKHFTHKYKKTSTNISKNWHALSKLKKEVKKAKHTLSSQMSTKLKIECFKNGNNFSEILTCSKFEELNINLFCKTMKPIEQVLQDASVMEDISNVQQLIKEYYGKEPSKGINPDETVAYGAAIQGDIPQKSRPPTQLPPGITFINHAALNMLFIYIPAPLACHLIISESANDHHCLYNLYMASPGHFEVTPVGGVNAAHIVQDLIHMP